MSRIIRFTKSLFGGRDKPGLEETPEALRAMFKSRYWNFKALLEANNKALEIMSSMEHALHESQSFGMSFVRANCTAMSVNVYKIIQNMNELSSNRYAELYDVFEQTQDNIAKILDEHKEIREGELVLPLEIVNKDMADQVGGKMANLGEIRSRVGLPVPEGFVITASAYKLFLEYNNLQEEISRLIQPLDLRDMEMLHRASSRVEMLVMRSPLPPELERHIMSAYRRLEEKTKRGMNLSVRSSALGEDTAKSSFAGQYRSNLNVSQKFLADAYKEIVASKYSPQAIMYRLNMGFRDEDIAMCVGCMAMVDAVSSGVMYSRDPANIRNDVIVINAVWGLAKAIVNGTVSPDLFVVSKAPVGRVLKLEIRTKDQKFVCLPEEGTCLLASVGREQDEPAITDEQAAILARLAVDLEDHFGQPQDIEWSIGKDGEVKVLQSRPLRQVDIKTEAVKEAANSRIEQPVVLAGGVTASPGVSSGRAFLVNTMVDLLQFPQGAVLVTEHSLPQWAAALDRAVAVITDRGGITGHLATVSREFGIPALFNTLEGTKRIESGTIVTVDADGRRVYAGTVGSLLKEASVEKPNLMKGSPVYNVLKRALEHLSPLNLTDPAAINFTPKNCKTYHDITRFCHEKAVKEMFNFGKDHHFPEHSSKQLVCDVPMQWWVIDLEDGFKEPVEGDTVDLENIASIPMLALWEGITAVPWEGPPPVDAKGFLSVMFQSTMDPSLDPTRRSRYSERNYFMISKHFCNLASRLGYHFSTVEAFVSANPRENYVSFNFKGGGADLNRRILRVKFIETILKKFDFRIDINEDCIMARLEGWDQDYLVERLKVLGYVSFHTRQLDMIMANQSVVNHYVNQHLRDIHSFVSVKAK
jgi:pyruvate,water dikinase